MKTQFLKTSLTSFLALIFSMLIVVDAFAQNEMPKPSSTGYAPVNGQRMYYEVYGQGRPLLLLHGAFMTIPSNWNAMIPDLAKTHQVIAVEMQGHGRTPDIDRPFLFKFAEDMSAFGFLKVDSRRH
jgi:hypothetical protein